MFGRNFVSLIKYILLRHQYSNEYYALCNILILFVTFVNNFIPEQFYLIIYRDHLKALQHLGRIHSRSTSLNSNILTLNLKFK